SRQLELERYRSRADLVLAQAARDRFSVRDQHAAQFVGLELQIAREGVFLSIRLALPIANHRPLVDSVGQRVQMRSHRAERRSEFARIPPRNVADRPNSV